MGSPERLRLDRFAVRALLERSDTLRTELDRTRSLPHPDEVHDLRVAIRRLLACLDAFPTVFRRRRAKRLHARLRRLFRSAGATRDADIALELQTSHGGRTDKLARRRAKCARSLRKRLRKSRVRKLLRRVQGIVRRAKKDRRDARAVAAESLAVQVEGLFARGRKLAERQAAAPELHRLRIQIKKLRYRLEVFQPLLGTDASSGAAELARLQTLLGEIQDCVTALSMLPADQLDARASIEARQRALEQEFYRHWREEFDAPGELDGWRDRLAGRAATAHAAATGARGAT